MNLDAEVKFVKGVGPKVATLLQKQGIETVEELIENFPRKFNDYSSVTTLDKIQPGLVTVRVKVENVSSRYVRRGMHLTEATIYDDTERARAVWFNQPYRKEQLKPDTWFFMSGEFSFGYNKFQLTNPAAELVSAFPKNTARIVPVYRETKGLKSHQIRRYIYETLPLVKSLPETLPKTVVESHKLMSRAQAVEQMHFPGTYDDFNRAKRRIAFEELFEIIYASLLNKTDNASLKTRSVEFKESIAKEYVKKLPFDLTDSQRKSAWSILQDLESNQPMNRLLEGDVGSGKTVVASMAILMALENSLQVAYMAPTEILARQQHASLEKLLQPFGHKPVLLIGGMKAPQKKKIQSEVASGKVKLLVGTHALIGKDVSFENLALIVVDEQHRFGVEQREELMKKSKHMPHVLTMTATPIPRSLALTLYGELDISILKEMPKGRKAVITEIHSPNSRNQLYEKIDKELALGRQAFVVCPLISESDKLGVKSVEQEFKLLNTGPFKHRKIALLHGKLKSEEKEKIMEDFVSGKYDILVTTTVVEVGVDVPNATIMLIEGVERFGLAQLHQLRGRVGRSDMQSYCFVVPTSSLNPPHRIQVFASSSDGFKLAELDLELRGPGEIYGERQHGALDLRIAKLSDHELITLARKSAVECIQQGLNLLQYPRLARKVDELRKVTNLN